MRRRFPTDLACFVAVAIAAASPALADEPAKGDAKKPAAAQPSGGAPVSFLKDVAPILVQNCIACHNPKKSESKYTMTTFAQLAKGGQQGGGLRPGGGTPDPPGLGRRA